MPDNKLLDKLNSYLQHQYQKTAMEIFKIPYGSCGAQQREIVRKYVNDCDKPEEWRVVVYETYDTNYETSNMGHVRNATTLQVIREKTTRDGYKMINIYIPEKGGRTTTTVHKLVANAFIPNPENKPVVNHINGDKGFNWIGNLERASYAENTQHAIAMGLQHSIGSDNPNNKFTDDEIRHVCKLLEKHEPTAVSKMPGVTVSKMVISGIKQRRIWTHISREYNIPEPVNQKRPSEMKEKMVEVIKAGGTVDDILKAAGLENVSKEREYVGLFRRRYLRDNPEYAQSK